MRFEESENRLFVVDRYSPRLITLDPWLELLFGMADGKHSVSEMIEALKKGYESAPDGLADLVFDVLSRLVNEKMVELRDSASELPYYLAIPVHQQDHNRALAAG
jgi:hypothetical protein